MTTVAFDGHTLAADTCATINGTRTRYSGKLRRLKKGALAGICGDVEQCEPALAWLDRYSHRADANEYERPKLKHGGEILVVTKDGKLHLYGSKNLVKTIIDETIYAMGSGGDIALGAMMHGATAAQAVAYAIQRDPHSGFDVVTLEL